MSDYQSWPPPLEVYCPKCRRMVAARVRVGLGPVPAEHFRFSDGSRVGGSFGQHDHYKLCPAWYGLDGMAPGREDPKAAFRYLPEEVPTPDDVLESASEAVMATVNPREG